MDKTNNKRRPDLWLLALLLVGALSYYHFSHRRRPIPTPEEQNPPTGTHPRIEPSKIKKERQKTNRAQPFKRPSAEVIPFVVDGDLAIAYGDIILGEVEPGVKIDKGFYRPSRPEFWRGEIPYFIDPELPDPARVKTAINYFNDYTPVRFIPFDNQEDAIIFVPGEENCYSYLGKVGGHQPIRLSNRCGWLETTHEIMHALGFIHEHSRSDRDEHVEVIWENIDEPYTEQFAIVPSVFMDTVRGTSFDYRSIMLYKSTAFAARQGLVTLRAKGGNQIAPETVGLSQKDLERLNYYYGD